MSTSFLDLSIGDINSKLKCGEMSVIDVTQMSIKRIKEQNAHLKAWVSFDEEILLANAKKRQARLEKNGEIRSLEGVPFGVKDIFNTREYPTQMGSLIWKDFTPGNDARVLSHLESEGGIIAGKTETAEFAVHTLGNSLNPHNPELTPGTSSSGSAIAVATGMVPLALGTQTAGSIVRPASFCGVYGCKPSFGLIPRTAMLKTTDSFDTVGFFAAHYKDLEIIFEAVRVRGTNYPFSHAALTDEQRQNRPADRPWRVAFAKTHTWELAPKYAQDALLEWVKKISEEKDIEIKVVDLPKSISKAHQIHATIYNKNLAYYFKEEAKKHELVSTVMYDLISKGNEISLNEYKGALKYQAEMAEDMDKFLEGFDAMVSLSTAGEAPARHVPELDDPALIYNMTYLPVISAPVFISPNQQPFGLQVTARRYNDMLLFRFMDMLNERGYIPNGVYPRLK